MSNENIRPQGAEGISHPRNVAKSSLIVNEANLRNFLRTTDDELRSQVQIAVDFLDRLEAVFRAIRDLAPAHQQPHINNLAALGEYVAADIASTIDCGRERFDAAVASFRQEIGGAA